MAIIVLGLCALYVVPCMGWKAILGYCAALLLSPFFLLTVLLIRGEQVRVLRMFAVLPYWIHSIPVEAQFELYEAWEDPAPTGVAFGSLATDFLHLGTAASADPLYRHVSGLLERAGWQPTAMGWARLDPDGPQASP
ncbi:hypothetical protein [Massilia sp. Dwa41.01b]|uniref:hypothetical protein n=2 Tax=unclassified Massilia TaxID=2609279 RepID=UPI001AEF0B41|nr:hypothetical protein [Massilia sp. Dwa41.01b]